MTTITLSELRLSPPLTLARSDHQQLARLALAGSGHSADAADDLLYELDRAQIVDDPKMPTDVVRMGSRVRFRTGRDERHVTLVWPAEADIAERRVSVLTPVGTALLGLRSGQSITFRTRDGRPQMLTVLGVLPPEGEHDDDGPRAA
ncbi:MAG: nucleoside diphosphate kinase regulator [Devosia sp.]|jgi:regulator of nucleoside diphosphate kinase|uniref:nucleoside diphosphate kinase regulator n=1 Tax=Devosia sp. TaxID=1871048 RepID=UPI001A478DCA|nr:nucleoside diphosphate kinase regulator [Devosia sp.]MBL8597032.1 nucleoside diphosphate kinase regulator [Devosia sp.]